MTRRWYRKCDTVRECGIRLTFLLGSATLCFSSYNFSSLLKSRSHRGFKSHPAPLRYAYSCSAAGPHWGSHLWQRESLKKERERGKVGDESLKWSDTRARTQVQLTKHLSTAAGQSHQSDSCEISVRGENSAIMIRYFLKMIFNHFPIIQG